MDNSVRSFLEYLELERNYSVHTLRAYESDLYQFVSFLHSHRIRSLQEVRKQQLRSFLAHLLDLGVGKRSVARKIAALRSFFRYLRREGILSHNPALALTTPKSEKRLPSYLDERTMLEVLNGPDTSTPRGRREAAILEIFYSTGIRLSELIGLTLHDVNLRDRTMKVQGKGSKERIVPMGTKAISALKDYLASRPEGDSGRRASSPLFVLENGKPCYPQAIIRMVKKHIGRVSEIQKQSPHVIRHTFATHLLNRGADLGAVKELLGHESLSTTQVYTHVSTERMKKVYSQAHPKA